MASEEDVSPSLESSTTLQGNGSTSTPTSAESERYEVPVSADDVKTGAVAACLQHRYSLRSTLRSHFKPEKQEAPTVRNRLVDMTRVVEMLNRAIVKHGEHTTTHLPHFTLGPEEKWGTACKQSLQCSL